jgi:hypothetical protein
MDIEKLTKTQIVLLALLVSFVTSIATGIITVSLVQQAPPAVTQTINRVVERTVERVVEKDKNDKGEPKVVTKEKTVLVKETDVVAETVKSAVPALASIYGEAAPAADQPAATTGATPAPATPAAPEHVFVARGLFVAADTIATDAAMIVEGKKYFVRSLASGTEVPVTAVKVQDGVAYLSVEKGTGTVLAEVAGDDVQLGQTVIALGGLSRLKVTTGIVSDIERDSDNALSSISVAADATPGTPLITMDGKLIAIFVKDTWVPASQLLQ